MINVFVFLSNLPFKASLIVLGEKIISTWISVALQMWQTLPVGFIATFSLSKSTGTLFWLPFWLPFLVFYKGQRGQAVSHTFRYQRPLPYPAAAVLTALTKGTRAVESKHNICVALNMYETHEIMNNYENEITLLRKTRTW
jgi:hypothetical protein